MSNHVPACEAEAQNESEPHNFNLKQYEAWFEGYEFAQRLFYGMSQPGPPRKATHSPAAYTKSASHGLGSLGPLKPGVGSKSDAL